VASAILIQYDVESMTIETRLADRERLKELLSGSPEHLRELVRSRFQAIVRGRENQFVLFGTGVLGRAVARGLRELGVEPVAFCDNNARLHGAQVHGIRVMSPSDAAERFRDRAVFVPAVFTSRPLLVQMDSLGLRTLPVPELFWQYSDTFLPFLCLELPEAVLEHKDDVREGLDQWNDQASREEYLAQIAWRTTLDRAALPPHLPQDEIYFPSDLFDLSPEELFVDCGAFDGDSLRALLGRVPGFRGFIGIEPDSANRSALQAFIDGKGASFSSRCTLLPHAVGDQSGTIHFSETGTVASSVNKSGSLEIPAERLDVLLKDVSPTFIKMDIEGAELVALMGGRKVIGEKMPVLAVCLYHRCSDLWEIPSLIHGICPDYRLFLRRYSDECWEQVCYAIPPGRLKH
jgi:FkbM family methyltransferase